MLWSAVAGGGWSSVQHRGSSHGPPNTPRSYLDRTLHPCYHARRAFALYLGCGSIRIIPIFRLKMKSNTFRMHFFK